MTARLLSAALALAPAASAEPGQPAPSVEDSYREALATAAAGSLRLAVSRIIEVEKETSPECLQALELRAAKRLARRDPESLVVQAFLRLAVSQARSPEWHLSMSPFAFERVSMDTLRRLADLYLATSRRDDAPSAVAGLETHMAHGISMLRSVERLEAAAELLEDALALDPNHRAALHSLAVTFDLLGQAERSLPLLERLLELDPGNPRFRVRRAVATVKCGRRADGRRLLEELRSGDPAWVRELAVQELARLLAEDGRTEEAVDVLREAVAEGPSGEKLHLQLAALLDPSWAESGEAFSAWLAAPREDRGPSARWIYEDSAAEELAVLRHQLATAVSERLAGLASALGEPDPQEDRHRRLPAVCR